MIIVGALSANYEIEVRMLENTPASLDRVEIERVVGNQYNRLLRQQHDSIALSASGSTVRRIAKKRREDHATYLRATASTAEGRVTALRLAGARRRRLKKTVGGPADKKDGGKGKYYVCGSDDHFAHTH